LVLGVLGLLFVLGVLGLLFVLGVLGLLLGILGTGSSILYALGTLGSAVHGNTHTDIEQII